MLKLTFLLYFTIEISETERDCHSVSRKQFTGVLLNFSPARCMAHQLTVQRVHWNMAENLWARVKPGDIIASSEEVHPDLPAPQKLSRTH